MSFDVAVLGLGAMGSAALCHLARRGLNVVGLERFARGHDRGSSHGETRAIRLGYFEHPSYVPLARAAYRNWHELERLTGEQVLTRTGVLEIGRPDSIIVAGSLEASLLHGLEHEVLDHAAIAARYPQFTLPPGYHAVFQPDGGYLRPERANALHLDLAAEAGADIRFSTPVTRIEPRPGGVALITAAGTIEAARVVVATGAWIGDLVPALASSLVITRQVLCWFTPRDPAAVAPEALPVFIVDGEDDIGYGFPDLGSGFKCASHHACGELGHADQARQDAGPGDETRMRRFLETYLPAAAGPLIRMSTCLYTRTPDEDFVIDLHPEDQRIVVASACSGHGFKFASVIGEVLADLATEQGTAHDISRFAIGRLGATPS